MTASTVKNPVCILSRHTGKSKYSARDCEQGVFIQALISRRRGSEAQIAALAGCSFAMVNYVVWGLKTSARIQLAIADYLGFGSWADLKNGQKKFMESFPANLKKGVV